MYTVPQSQGSKIFNKAEPLIKDKLNENKVITSVN